MHIEKITDLDSYQAAANEMINVDRYPGLMDFYVNCSLGLCGESGEFADIIKKVVYHGHKLDDDAKLKLKKELGDILWYIAQGCLILETPLSDIATLNIQKLTDRHGGNKFSETASANKNETKEAVGTTPNPAGSADNAKSGVADKLASRGLVPGRDY